MALTPSDKVWVANNAYALFYLKSPDGSVFAVTVGDDGTLSVNKHKTAKASGGGVNPPGTNKITADSSKVTIDSSLITGDEG